MEELRESAEAKVLGRQAVIFSDGLCGGSAASSEVEGRLLAAGKSCDRVEEVEKGFEGLDEPVPVENGFADGKLDEDFAPKSVSPMPVLPTGFGTVDCVFGADFSFFSLDATSDIFVPRSTLTLPSLRLHVFLRHVNM